MKQKKEGREGEDEEEKDAEREAGRKREREVEELRSCMPSYDVVIKKKSKTFTLITLQNAEI